MARSIDISVVVCSVPPLSVMPLVALPNAEFALMLTVPPLIVVPPAGVLVPLRVSVPAPVLIEEPLPVIACEISVLKPLVSIAPPPAFSVRDRVVARLKLAKNCSGTVVEGDAAVDVAQRRIAADAQRAAGDGGAAAEGVGAREG